MRSDEGTATGKVRPFKAIPKRTSGGVRNQPYMSRSGGKYCSPVIIAPANLSVLDLIFAWFIVTLITVGLS
jgi:hypothetical protein